MRVPRNPPTARELRPLAQMGATNDTVVVTKERLHLDINRSRHYAWSPLRYKWIQNFARPPLTTALRKRVIVRQPLRDSGVVAAKASAASTFSEGKYRAI